MTFLDQHTDIPGIQCGTSSGSRVDSTGVFYHVIEIIHSSIGNCDLALKTPLPIMSNIKRAVRTALQKHSSNCCMAANVLYATVVKSANERKRKSR